ncbi:MAG: 3,4-dihydroxy-2-butanone-4-phosphate synthase [Actinobacteria bacterium]|uniref:GTP cyclohydrolase II n=1 Tax=freshwater metagenome TaxID=449393 RepID=A0A6J7DXT4_9ZZZZ|nr:3,4-dihydroxy-2-butanone-4-phosphate synthase [Actinomycetota bacterium]
MSDFKAALDDFKSGKFLIVTDDANRENEGDLILLAEKATTEQIGFMVRHTSGVICSVITQEIAKALKLPMMVARNEDSHETAFTVSVDAIEGRTTGISAEERANTLRAIANPNATPTQFLRPGHVFPLVAVAGGVHERAGHTEAGIALCELTESYPVAVISELVNDDGSMMRGDDLENFAAKNSIKKITIEQIKAHVEKKDSIKKIDFQWAKLPIREHEWQITTFTARSGTEHAILALGDLQSALLLSRIHSECLTGDAFGSLRCDCGPQLLQAITEIETRGSGLIIYLRDHEGRGIGLSEKIRAYALQDNGQNTLEANISLGHGVDERSYTDAIEIMRALDVTDIELLTNNPEKLAAFVGSGINYMGRTLQVQANSFNKEYLMTKRDLLSHSLGEI